MNIVKYEEFRKKNPDFQSRVEAFTGILTPDPKGITLWSMKPGRVYSYRELFEEVCKFSDHDPGSFPLTQDGVWQYYHGNPAMGREGSLHRIGAVVKLEIEKVFGGGKRGVPVYQKTDVGRDFGDAIVARGTYLVDKLWNNKNKPRYCSLWKILSRANKPRDAEVRRGYGVYVVIKLLYENPETEFRMVEIVEETGLSEKSISRILISLGKSGIIDYKSFRRGKSIAKANEHTKDVWEVLLEPIERVSRNLDPYACSGFYDILDDYMGNDEKRVKAIKNQLRIYNRERSHKGPKGGEELRGLILEVMSIGEEMKLSHIQERVSKIGEREMSTQAVYYQLRRLMEWGCIEKSGRGFYKKIRSLPPQA